MFPFKKSIFVVLFSLSASFLTSCSEESSTGNIRATLFLLDASKSMALSIGEREQQLKQRLDQAFDEKRQEAIYFDFIRNNFSKQLILPLVSMQTILNVNDEVLTYAKDDRVRRETRELISNLWRQSLSDAKSVSVCTADVTKSLDTDSYLAEGSRFVAQNICISAEKAKDVMNKIRTIGAGDSVENGFIGSDIEGAFVRGLDRLESESRNLRNSENQLVSVTATIIVSSDMMQRNSRGDKVIDTVRTMTEAQIDDYVTELRSQQEIIRFKPIVKIDGWASTKKNYSDKDRQALELYWKRWFTTLGLQEPDFGFGVMDWSVDQ